MQKQRENPFEKIALEWSKYRSVPSPSLRFFLPLIPKGGVVLDAGCGSGRNFAPITAKAGFVYGVDSAKNMVRLAKEQFATKIGKKLGVKVADVSKLSFEDEKFDCVFCIAVLHNVSSKQLREKAMAEFYRVLKPKGRLALTVWNIHQKRFASLGKKRDADIGWTLKTTPQEKQSQEVGRGGNASSRVARYYHFFEKKELRALAEKNGFKVEELFYEKKGERHAMQGAANLCAVLVKA